MAGFGDGLSAGYVLYHGRVASRVRPRPVRSLPPSKLLTGPACPRRSVCAPATVATAGKDYTPMSQTLDFAPFERQKGLPIPILADTVFDPDETFEVVLTAVSGVEVVAPPWRITIKDEPALILHGIRLLPDASVEMTYYATPELGYFLEASDDLRAWWAVDGIPIPDPSLGENFYRWVDQKGGDSPARFYRLKSQ